MRFDACRQAADGGEILKIDGVGAADGQGHAMHDQGIALAYPLQVVQRLAAGDEIVLGDDLEPIDGMTLVEDGLVVRGSEAKAETGKFHECRAMNVARAEGEAGAAACRPGPGARDARPQFIAPMPSTTKRPSTS